ncbi:uncharacterized protein DUF861 [Aquimarina sp. MAR_2010_214]|uniref:cupin domain-containing protein n=1 Tax=Aquimarina sp. MAR_2010_214 TaxID=1250026 RepID=UPI000CBD3059|nr:cupin domain-containing protein [Aquimarina sp. MAR_2010_214]PKV49522.1 uncharacterized protein DUF861 [Aquimarina sp. MAR_2010_214]
MIITRILMIVALCTSLCTYGQDGKANTENMSTNVSPVLLDKKMMSGIGLKQVKAPWDPDRELYQKRIYNGIDLGIYVVCSETAKATWENYKAEEFIYVINGQAKLTPKGEKTKTFNAGDFFFAPRGYTGDWETVGGNKYYYELAVVAKKKGETSKSEIPNPFLVDKERFSGINITRIDTPSGEQESYRDMLYEGEDLTMVIEAEKPQKKEIKHSTQEQLIYVIGGAVNITPKGEVSSTFFTGDFFVLPQGFTGSWESEGFDLFRTLNVTKSK